MATKAAVEEVPRELARRDPRAEADAARARRSRAAPPPAAPTALRRARADDLLPAARGPGRGGDPRPVRGALRRSADARGGARAAVRDAARRRACRTRRRRRSATSRRRSRPGLVELDRVARLPDDKVVSELVLVRGHRRVDRAHVPDVPAGSARRVADARLRRAQRLRAACTASTRCRRRSSSSAEGDRFRPYRSLVALVLLARGRHRHARLTARTDCAASDLPALVAWRPPGSSLYAPASNRGARSCGDGFQSAPRCSCSRSVPHPARRAPPAERRPRGTRADSARRCRPCGPVPRAVRTRPRPTTSAAAAALVPGDTVHDPIGDVPIPQSDISGAGFAQNSSSFVFGTKVVAPIDPKRDPAWQQGLVLTAWALDANNDGNPEYIIFLNPDGAGGLVALHVLHVEQRRVRRHREVRRRLRLHGDVPEALPARGLHLPVPGRVRLHPRPRTTRTRPSTSAPDDSFSRTLVTTQVAGPQRLLDARRRRRVYAFGGAVAVLGSACPAQWRWHRARTATATGSPTAPGTCVRTAMRTSTAADRR